MSIPYRPIAAGLITLLLVVGCGQAEPLATSVPPEDTPAPPTPSPIPSAATAAPPADTPPPTPSPTPQPLPEIREMIDVGGHQLYIHCTGTGTPTVIMEAGYGDVGQTWSLVQPEVARFTRACSYDRADLGLSDPGPDPRHSLQIVDELHTLLGNAGIEGPFVLVGHSMGGLYMRLYAGRHRQDVVGLVLVDSAHPDQFRRQAAVLPPESPDDSESLRFYRDWFTNAPDDPTLDPALFEAGSLGDMPLVVLTAPNKERAADFPAELNARFNQIWVELQEELVQLSSNSIHVISDKSQHFIQRDQPELVVDAIRQVITAMSTPTPPTLTHALSPEPAALPYDVVRDLPLAQAVRENTRR
jgi:pimeloyl-ACP methyl ester carboxylesterase